MDAAKRSRRIIFFLLILLLGMWMRVDGLAVTPPAGDESESALNALTILRDGIPRGEYLGLPIYENVLTEPWPGQAEYEFRDSSYSPSGVAIYHGWLPLYAMAASFKALGIAPDGPPAPGAELKVRHDNDEIRRRVIAARLPSLLFSGLFMIVLFATAWEMFGADAAWAAMLVGAIGRPFVYMGREARYHAATMALSTACCWAIWRVYQYGRWRDYLIGAAGLVLLFYTHLLAFSVGCVMLVAIAPALLRQPRALAKLLAAGAIVAGLTMPWLIGTGFLVQHTHIPPVRAFLNMPLDLFWYPILNIPYLLLPLALLAWVGIVFLFRRHLPPRVVQPLAQRWREIAFLLAWIALGLLAFTFLIPAASYFYKRLTLAVMGPGVVWASIVIAAATRACNPRDPRRSVLIAPAAFTLIVIACNMANLWFLEQRERDDDAYIGVDHLRRLHLAPDTKIYCTPNDQLTLTFLTGLPVQSVAPIRKGFLDSYPGPILIIDSTRPFRWLSARQIERIAREQNYPLAPGQAERLIDPLMMSTIADHVRPHVASVDPPDLNPPLAPQVKQFLIERVRAYWAQQRRRGYNTPLLRGFELNDSGDWWPLFFYRFVEPLSRMGDRLNYADRIRGARAEVLPNSWVFYHCPPLSR